MGREALMDIPELVEIEAEARAMGEARGRIEGRRALVANMIKHRFGFMPEIRAMIDSLSSCDATALDEIGILVLDAPKESLVAAIEQRTKKPS
jgi:hypothetical protein